MHLTPSPAILHASKPQRSSLSHISISSAFFSRAGLLTSLSSVSSDEIAKQEFCRGAVVLDDVGSLLLVLLLLWLMGVNPPLEEEEEEEESTITGALYGAPPPPEPLRCVDDDDDGE